MSRRTKPAPKAKAAPSEDEVIVSSFRVPRTVVERFDAWIEKQNEARRGPKLTRADVIRGLMDWAADKEPTWEER